MGQTMLLRRLTWATTATIAIQMVLGGIIVGKDAGFVCPNWPLCGDAGLPPVTPSLILELVHRFSALLVTVLVMWVIALILARYRAQRQLLWTAVFAFLSLLLQMVVGGLIVRLQLPGVVTTVDVMNSMALLALFVHISNLARAEGRETAERGCDEVTRSLIRPAWFLFWTGMLAVFVGAVFRHTGASQALFGENSYLLSHGQHTMPSMTASTLLLSIHILTGGLAGATAVWFAVAARKVGRLRAAGIAAIALVVLQAVVGIASLASRLQLVVATIHWGLAGLIIGLLAWIVSETHVAPMRPVERLSRSA